jgi:electron transport complex protein RnfC
MKKKTFPHGTHPPPHKVLTADKPLEKMPAPDKVYIPLHQHFGAPAAALVKKGDEVFLGQKIGQAAAFFSASVHSSVSGKVLAVEAQNHPLGKPVLTVTIANDGQDKPAEPSVDGRDPFSLSADQVRDIVKEAGIVGLGGAAFPTAVKLSPPKEKTIDTIIINGCECEPLLTADYRMMLEFPEDILKGAELIRKTTGAQKIILGVEDNKLEAFELLKEKNANPAAEVALVKTKYPQGAEKNLIAALLGRKVPRGGLPFDVGVIVQNVATAKAVWDAAETGKPLFERAMTVSGRGVREPKNLMVRIGTPFRDVLDFCGGLHDDANTIIMGGPMMGLAQWSLDTPVIKGTSGLLAWADPNPPKEFSCIRCSRCVAHCPMGLVPTQLMKLARNEMFAEMEAWGALDCVECGCCQYSCPANIPLVHWIRLGKTTLVSLKRKKSA